MSKKIIFLLFIILCFFSVVFYYVRSKNIETITLVGTTMEPNFTSGQICEINKFIITVSRGDVIIFPSPTSSNIQYYKRVIGIPGDTISIKSGDVYLNGILQVEDYLLPDTKTTLWEDGYVTEGEDVLVPNNSFFVMGDNRLRSSDSREWGFVNRKDIIGKIIECT